MPRSSLSRQAKAGRALRLGRGVYVVETILPSEAVAQSHRFTIIEHFRPGAVLCGITALQGGEVADGCMFVAHPDPDRVVKLELPGITVHPQVRVPVRNVLGEIDRGRPGRAGIARAGERLLVPPSRAESPVVLTGTGRRFSAGLDLREHFPLFAGDRAAVASWFRDYRATNMRLFTYPRPTAAAVTGTPSLAATSPPPCVSTGSPSPMGRGSAQRGADRDPDARAVRPHARLRLGRAGCGPDVPAWRGLLSGAGARAGFEPRALPDYDGRRSA